MNVKGLLANSHLFLAILWLASSVWGGFDLNSIPNGYPDGRSDAPVGAYDTVLSGQANDLLNDLKFLEHKIYGLGSLPFTDDLKRAEAHFYLEHHLIAALNRIAISGVTGFDREILLHRGLHLFRHLRTEGERLYESMIRQVDVALPGPNGGQITVRGEDGSLLYYPNCRSEQKPTPEFQKQFYVEKLAKFLADGGQLTEIFPLTTETLEKLPAVSRLEYVQRPDSSVWVTEGTAGHIILAAGGPVLAAGQLLLIKDSANHLEIVAITNASGTYKPDLATTVIVEEYLRRVLAGTPFLSLNTKGEFIGIQTMKILMKAKGVGKEAANLKVAELETEAKTILGSPKSLLPIAVKGCGSALAKIIQ